VAAVAFLTVALFGGAIGVATSILQGGSEQAQGAYVSEETPAFWNWSDTLLDAIPAVVPGAASTDVAAPTLLPAGGQSFVIDPSTAGHPGIRWQFQEATTAPQSTELELRFVAGLVNSAVHITVYLETQAVIPGAAVDYFLYWDAGTFASGSLSVETMQVVVLACASVGACP